MADNDKFEVGSDLLSLLYLRHGLVGNAEPALVDAFVDGTAVAGRMRHLRKVEVGPDVLDIDGAREGQDNLLVAVVAEQGLLRLGCVILRKSHDSGPLGWFLAWC